MSSSRPEEQRYLFEESTGITKIKVNNAERVSNRAAEQEGLYLVG
jgi:chromosome segregation ATPase